MPDKKTIGLVPEQRLVVDRMVESGLFKDQMDAAKFAMGLAIADGTPADEVSGADTTWATGNFDPDGEIRKTIEILYPGVDAPYRAVEHFINAGLVSIQARSSTHGPIDFAGIVTQSVGPGPDHPEPAT